jgi:recombinational DNA repair protein RecR
MICRRSLLNFKGLPILESPSGGRRIHYGLPMGGDINYADQQTLKEALGHRVEA